MRHELEIRVRNSKDFQFKRISGEKKKKKENALKLDAPMLFIEISLG